MSVAKRFVIIGDPVAHSLSPRMHTAGYKALGIENQFLFDFHRVTKEELPSFIKSLPSSDISGAACTMPHKERLIELVDWIDPAAQQIGAINTLIIDAEVIKGFNTDWRGILDPLSHLTSLNNKRALILGAGGASRAALFALSQNGVSLYLSNRTTEKAEQLRKHFPLTVIPWQKRFDDQSWDIIINTTSIGMYPEVNASPLEGFKFNAGQIVYETIYHPRETKLILAAKEAGAKILTGLDMLLYQGAFQFEIFTGKVAPTEAMRAALQ